MKAKYFLVILIKCLIFNEFVVKVASNFEVKKSLIEDKTYARRLHPNGRSYLYLNYKEAYGLRFDPKKIYKKRQNDPSTWEDVPISTTSVSISTEDNVTSDEMQTISSSTSTEATLIIPTTIASPSSSDVSVTTLSTTTENSKTPSPVSTKPSKQQILAFPTLRNRFNVSKQQNTTTNQRPNVPSSLKETLQLIRKRIKQWLAFGSDSKASLINGQRFLNVFNVIKFDNSPCTSTKEGLTEMSGICYHDYQCTQMGGSSIDECADGLGVCCVCMHFFSIDFIKHFLTCFQS